MPPLLLLHLLLLLLSAAVATKVHHSSFSLDFFPAGGDGAIAQLALFAANVTSTGAISMRSPHARVHYHKPIHFTAGFSTYFSFSLTPSPSPSPTSPTPKSSLAFFLTPAGTAPTDALLAVVFFTDADYAHTRIRIDLAGDTSAPTTPFSHAQKLHSWIDYNTTSAMLQVRLSASRVPKPPRPLLSYPLRLDTLLRGRRNSPMLAGFASQAANCTLFSWAFRANPYLMHSQPLDPTGLLTTPPSAHLHSGRDTPPRYRYRYYPSWVSLLFAGACGAMLTFFLLFVWYLLGARRPVSIVPVDPSDVVYEKIVLVGVKDDAHHVPVAAAGNKQLT